MNQIYFLINIFFLLYSNIFKFNNCKLVNEVVDYSYLLPKVRIDLVNKALKVLPGKGFVDILKMCNSMAKLKGTYEMNDIEGAFLLYQWIIKNINIICKPKKDEESSIKVYKSGEGNAYEISTLYKTMSYYLNITSGLIRGYIRNFDNRTYLPVEPYDWVWNYILINNTYYLVDVSFGKGGCFGNNERYYDNIFFFGTKPEFFISSNYPIDNKWQLLNEPVPFEKFKNNTVKDYSFYEFGYTSISPENYTLEGGKEEITITLYYDEIFPDCERSAQYSFFNPITKYGTEDKQFTKISEGLFEAKISTKNKDFFKLRVLAHEECGYQHQYSAIIANYFINHTKVEKN